MRGFRESARAFRVSTSVVIPVFNEEATLPELIERCLAACRSLAPFEIVLVDDGSVDGSRRIISELAEAHPGRIVGVLLNRNYGQHAAVIAGLSAAAGDFTVTLDADLQNPPEEIPRIVEQLRRGHDVVGSVRTPRRDRLFRRIASRLVNRMTARCTGVEMTDYGCMLRGYKSHIVEAMLQCKEHGTFIPVLANTFASNPTEIEVAHSARTNGDSKYGLWKLVNLQLDLLTTMTKMPLRLLSFLGLAMSTFGVGLAVLLLVLRLIFGAAWAADGVFTLFAALFAIVGFQFVGLGILGEYLSRVYDDVRARPRYFVERTIGRSQLSASAAAGLHAELRPADAEERDVAWPAGAADVHAAGDRS
jgi:undecaprenyl-phosphate 4-deoxy-4-formamido-L-arabinose transferase